MQVDPKYLSSLTQSLSLSSGAEQTLTAQLSSGLRVGTLSDDPVAASINVGLASQLAGLDSFVQSASGSEGLLQVTDSTLGEVVTQLTSAIGLATQAANGTLNASNQAAIATQVSAIRDGILGLANTSYQGSYLFSGSQGSTRPFSLDATTSPATTVYSGDQMTNSIATPGGQPLALNVPGDTIFSGVLGTLNQVLSDLQSGSTAGITSASAQLSTALGTVSLQRSTIGASLSQLTSASGYAQTQAAQLTAQQTTLLSADTATVATNLQTAEVQHQALLSVVAALGQTDLFSYLK